jgi:hypothetical protein
VSPMNIVHRVPGAIASATLIATVVAMPHQVHGWEAQTTHAGLAEQAALASTLHERLMAIGFSGGLFESLTIPPADAPALLAVLGRLSPTHGTLPDARGRMTALAWLAAGAAIADSSADVAANHFYDPYTKTGYQRPSRALVDRLSNAVMEQVGRASLPPTGEAATTWINSKNNPLALTGFYEQYAKAVTAATPGERARHMAAALVAVGSALHALGDMGTPSHVRSDVLEHVSELGADANDVGSRFERIAALAFGRLGVPSPARVVTRESVEAFFTNATGTGLADLTAASYFSLHTMPSPAAVTAGSASGALLARPAPALPKQLNLMAASRGDGATLRNDRHICLARYRVANGKVSFFTDDDCQLEQITALLPEVASFEAGLLEFLFRGQLKVSFDGTQVNVSSALKLGAGTLTVVAQDASGVRTVLANNAISAGGNEAIASVPATGNLTWFAVYRGIDGKGQPLVAVGSTVPVRTETTTTTLPTALDVPTPPTLPQSPSAPGIVPPGAR